MILLAALAIWLVLLLCAVALCRIAAAADGRDSALTDRYPSISQVLQDLRPRVRDAQGRAGRYAA